MVTFLTLLVILGIFAGPSTLLHTFSVSIDILAQSMLANTSMSITLSSRAGMAKRRGRPLAARCINALFFDAHHCENAIASDIARSQEALRFLGHAP